MLVSSRGNPHLRILTNVGTAKQCFNMVVGGIRLVDTERVI
jgi:hypothetical protein